MESVDLLGGTVLSTTLIMLEEAVTFGKVS